MSVTFLDPTLPSRLPSANEVIDARVQSPLEELTISLRRANGKWDVIYQDGIFGLDYFNSTIENNGADDNTFHISRSGGWIRNEPIEFRFKEGAAPSGAVALNTIYEVDFRTLPSQSFGNTPASYTIDGLTWWTKGSLTGLPFGSVMDSQLINGQGLALGVTSFGNAAVVAAAGDHVYRMLVLPLAGVPGFNPLAPLIIRAKFTGTDSACPGFLGLIDTTSDGALYLDAQRPREMLVGTDGGPANLKQKYGANGWNTISTRTPHASTWDGRLMGIYRTLTRFPDVGDQPWDGAGSIPSPDGLRPHTQPLARFDTGALTNPCVGFLYSNQTGQPGLSYMTHLSISQPRI